MVPADLVDRVAVVCSGLDDDLLRKNGLDDVLDDWLELRGHEEVVPVPVVPEDGLLDDAALQFHCPLGDVLV